MDAKDTEGATEATTPERAAETATGDPREDDRNEQTGTPIPDPTEDDKHAADAPTAD